MTVRGEAVAEFGTGLVRTTVVSRPDGTFEWRRSPGPLAPAPFPPVDEEVYGFLAALSPAGGARLALGAAEGSDRVYQVSGQESVAHRLLQDGADAALQAPLYGLGRLLRALHASDPPASLRDRAAGRLAHLGDWLSGRTPSPRAARAFGHLRSSLGAASWEVVRAWYEQVVRDEDVVLAHGAPGLGKVIIGAGGATADVLTGEDVCLAPWYFDLGWVVGELVELRWFLGGQGGQEAWQGLLEALFSGYGRDLGPTWNRMATLRIIIHLHDFASYVGFPPEEFDRYAGFLKFLISLDKR